MEIVLTVEDLPFELLLQVILCPWFLKEHAVRIRVGVGIVGDLRLLEPGIPIGVQLNAIRTKWDSFACLLEVPTE